MSKLWEYLAKQYDLSLLDSEIDDILTLARQEIELPDREEIEEAMNGDNVSAMSSGGFELLTLNNR